MSSSSAQLRKIKKPLIERRRRERINDSLTQLKNLVLEATKKDETRYSKMEKADILEMTVAYLRTTQCRRRDGRHDAAADEPDERGDAGGGEQRYAAGFRQCAVHVDRYLVDSGVVGFTAVRDRLMSHLEASLRQASGSVDDTGATTTTTAAASWTWNTDVDDAADRCSPYADDLDVTLSGTASATSTAAEVVRLSYAASPFDGDRQPCRLTPLHSTDSAGGGSPRSADEFPSLNSASSSSCGPILRYVIAPSLTYSESSLTESSFTSDCETPDIWRPW